mmetsp:Transcript_38403/g.48461  ORF Transcript_38403/g.48461 Transcript_38403/m.48461 type:complete len:469 (-) Transcript_38403:551-1957(-)
MDPTGDDDNDDARVQSNYVLEVDAAQDDRATAYNLCSFARPHMRAFYMSTFGFFSAFLAWFSFAPLMPIIKQDLNLTKDQIWTANICSVSSTIVARFMIGPLTDKLGARLSMGVVLIVFAIPVAIGGFVVSNGASLAVMRFIIGVIGCVFVPCQAWVSSMFAHQIAGVTQALAGGWGNLGGGVTQFFMAFVYSLFRTSANQEMAWRSSFVVPAIIIFIIGLSIVLFTDDCPKGNYKRLHLSGEKQNVDTKKAFKEAASISDSWILFVQYACCFGVELTMNNLAASYFNEQFGLEATTAAYVASSFGGMNLFARALGGKLSDFAYASLKFGHHPLNSRLLVQGVILIYEGLMIIVFSRCTTFGSALAVMMLFSLGVQMSEGATFALVPFVKQNAVASVSGIVGAGGNVGAMCWGFIFLFGPENPQTCLLILGIIVLASAFITFFLKFSDANKLVQQELTSSKTKEENKE